MASVTICSDFGAQESSLSLFPLFPPLFAMKYISVHVQGIMVAVENMVAFFMELTLQWCSVDYK